MMLKRVFPERPHKSASSSSGNNINRSGSSSSKSPNASTSSDVASQLSPSQSQSRGGGYLRTNRDSSDISSSVTTNTLSSSTNSSPLKSSGLLTTTRLSSSSSGSPVKSEALQGAGGGTDQCLNSAATNLSKLKNISRSCSSTEFQSLKLESMSTVEDFKSVSKTISSALDRDGVLNKQASTAPSASAHDAHESTSLSTPSDEDTDNDPAESLFQHQAKFFCQMKEYLLSQQSSLRQHLEVLNATVASRKKKIMASRRQRFQTSGHSVHIPAKQKPDVTPEIRGNNHEIDLLNEFHSCSSTEKSDDDMQVCPLCGVEVEDSENPAALEEHVASHWCSLDDPI